VTLALEGPGGTVVHTATTDKLDPATKEDRRGAYSLKVPSGDWTVRVAESASATVLDGRLATTSTSESRTVSVPVSGVNFGYVRPVVISGLVWEDADGDGARDAGEQEDGEQEDGEEGIGGVTLTLTKTDGTGGAPTTTTNDDGEYSFQVPAGEWTVTVTVTAGILTDHEAPARTSVTADVSVGGADNTVFNYGYQPSASTSDVGVVLVSRLAGEDRYATVAAVSKEMLAPGVGTVYVATGEDSPTR